MNRINIICLGVKDMEKSIRFYKDGLGFETKETSYNPPVIFFNTASGLKFELFPIDQLAKDINSESPIPVTTGFSGVTLA
jgi:catechol 2,3-dioxygenase-like lactoylglutathione lyase family enzyme